MADLITAIAALLGAIVWPALFLIVIIMFRTPLKAFVSNMSQFSVKAPGIEASASRLQAAAALGAATQRHASAGEGAELPTDVAQIAQALPDERQERGMMGATVLWVDDNPNSSVYERRALQAFGVSITGVLSTEEALSHLSVSTPDLVISDMSRPPDPTAGFTLLDAMHQSGYREPVIFYTGTATTEQVQQARQRGALGLTNKPDDLLSMVVRVLGGRR